MIQIDVLNPTVDNKLMVCNLYTGDRCIKIYMTAYDYTQLISDGFFIRDGKELDSANVLNTTDKYHKS